jgi:hypothetical protein
MAVLNVERLAGGAGNRQRPTLRAESAREAAVEDACMS